MVSSRRFSNPWPSFQAATIGTVLKSSLVRRSARGRTLCTHGTSAPNLVTPDFRCDLDGARVMWLDHASVYLQIPSSEKGDGLGILFDPIFSSRCSPFRCLGPKRRVAPPCDVADLPGVHMVIISHDHYDHLDKATIREIERFHPDVEYFVPMGVGVILCRFGVLKSRIHEMKWWESRSIRHGSVVDDSEKISMDISPLGEPLKDIREIYLGRAPSYHSEMSNTTLVPDTSSLRITCTPAQHNSGRMPWSRNRTLWASWVVEWDQEGSYEFEEGTKTGHRVYFGGDTGYRSSGEGPVCPIFEEIYSRVGPPDLALLPIASGSVLPYLEQFLPFGLRFDNTALTRAIHCTPKDAIDAAIALGAVTSVGVHWGTYTTSQAALETLHDLRKATDQLGGGEKGVVSTCDVGAWVSVDTSS